MRLLRVETGRILSADYRAYWRSVICQSKGKGVGVQDDEQVYLRGGETLIVRSRGRGLGTVVGHVIARRSMTANTNTRSFCYLGVPCR
jgi:hypothetical protein